MPYNIVIKPLQPRPAAPPVPPAPTPHNPTYDLTDKDGLDGAYNTDADLSTKKTLHVRHQDKTGQATDTTT